MSLVIDVNIFQCMEGGKYMGLITHTRKAISLHNIFLLAELKMASAIPHRGGTSDGVGKVTSNIPE